MVKQTSLLSDLQSILGSESVLPPEQHTGFAVDGLVPQAAVAPATVEQVAEVMRYAHSEGAAVVPWGGGAMMHIGNLPQRYDIALSLCRLNQVIEHEPADLTVTCQAGIALDDLQRHLAGSSQFLPLDPPDGERATIGGILAANASGPSRYAYGAARDFTLGMQVVTADGRITRAGGRVVKNVAGYDLCKLYIGSRGTLVIIVEATFKVAPLPREERTLVLGFGSPAEACAFAAALHRRGLTLRAIDLLNAPAAARVGLPLSRPYALLLWLAGTPLGLQRSHDEIAAAAAGASVPLSPVTGDEKAWEAARRLAMPVDSHLLCKVSVLPSRLPELVSAAEAISSLSLLVRPTIGVMYASWPGTVDVGEVVRRMRAATAQMGGALVVESCSSDIKRHLDVFGDPPPSFDLMRRVKQQFDPRGILNPGRFLGGI